MFGNAVLNANAQDASDAASVGSVLEDDRALPRSASVVAARDGYHPNAMLFVDEGFANAGPSARDGTMSGFMWKPVVRFCSTHYRFEWDDVAGTPVVVQVGIGAERDAVVHTDASPLFGTPSPLKVATVTASPRART